MKNCIVCQDSSHQKKAFEKDDFTYCRCGKCGLVYIDNESRNNECSTSGHYKDIFEINRSAGENSSPIIVQNLNVLFDKLEKAGNKGTVLDIGCQYGGSLKVARSRGWEVEGIEPFEEIVEYGRSIGITMYGKGLLDCRLPSEKYDLIMMSEVVEHLKNPEDELKEIYRLLAHGGLFYLTTPNYNSLMRFMLGTGWDIIYPEHLFYFSPGNLKTLLRKCGFEIIETKCDNFYPNVVFNKLKKRLNPKTQDYAVNFNSNYEFRDLIKGNRFLRLLKLIINFVLNLTKSGSDMKIIARKK